VGVLISFWRVTLTWRCWDTLMLLLLLLLLLLLVVLVMEVVAV